MFIVAWFGRLALISPLRGIGYYFYFEYILEVVHKPFLFACSLLQCVLMGVSCYRAVHLNTPLSHPLELCPDDGRAPTHQRLIGGWWRKGRVGGMKQHTGQHIHRRSTTKERVNPYLSRMRCPSVSTYKRRCDFQGLLRRFVSSSHSYIHGYLAAP